MATQSDLRRQISQKIVDALTNGTAPWRRPWSALENTGSPANVVSKRSYTGVNPLLLQLVGWERGYSSRWWGTFKQWTDLGFRVKARPCNVCPGEWGSKVVLCKPVTKAAAQGRADGGQREAVEREGRYLLLREFHVFNAEQVEGEGVEKYLARPRTTAAFEGLAPADEVIAATGADIRHGGGKAVYCPNEDYIRLPPRESFAGRHEYYATAFHELGHWSGHESRLARLTKNARFGSAAYSFEELVAEIAGCFLCGEVGVPQSDDLSNQAAYLGHWLGILRADPSAILTAANQASAACDFILRFGRQEPDDGAGEENELTAA